MAHAILLLLLGCGNEVQIAEPPGSVGPNNYYIVATGQSLSIGFYGAPPLSTAQPYRNLMFLPGVEGTETPLTALFESGMGSAGNVETPSSGTANSLAAYVADGNPVIVGLSGLGGASYAQLEKGTPPYTKSLTQAANAQSYVAATPNAKFIPIAITVTHGEADAYAGTPTATYEADLLQWQSDFQTDIGAIAGTTPQLPMIVSQMNSIGSNPDSALAQLQAHIDAPGKVILAGPKYQMTYSDGIHLTNLYYRYLGELYAKVIYKVVFQHQVWNPLMPTAIVANGNKIDITYSIPFGTLAIDTANVAPRANDGFEFLQTGGNSPTITGVALVANGSQVELTLSAVPTGTAQHVRYALDCPLSSDQAYCGQASDPTKIGGNLRDTDASVSPAADSSGLPLFDWSVAFDEPVGFRLP